MLSRTLTKYIWLLTLTLAVTPALLGAPRKVSFSQSTGSLDAYDFVEVTASIEGPDARNPFTDATLGGSERVNDFETPAKRI